MTSSKMNIVVSILISLFSLSGCSESPKKVSSIDNKDVKTNSDAKSSDGVLKSQLESQSIAGNTAENNDDRGLIINVKKYGAIGNGKANDTKAIQKAINVCPQNGTVWIEKNMLCNVNTLKMKSGINLKADGKLKQITAAGSQTFGKPLQNSSSPLILLDKVNNISIQINGQSTYEGIFLINSDHITIANSILNGSHSSLGFAGIMMYTCSDIKIENSEILNYGKERTSVDIAQPGSGIRALQVNNLIVLNNKIHNNGDNGLFTITSKNVIVDHNTIYSNGLSGIQIAFDASFKEYNYQITGNNIHNNMADGIDINNFQFKTRDIKILIKNNLLKSNGFVNGKSTADGSGIATLINLSNVIVSNNRSSLSNRSALYVKGCGVITASNNVSDKPVEIIDHYERLDFTKNTFQSIDLVGETSGESLKIIGNTISNISLPNGTKSSSIIIESNKIKSCNINLNVTGKVSFVKNVTQNNISKGSNSLYISQVSQGLLIDGNVMKQSSNADCIVIASQVPNIMITNNSITGINNLITDVGAPGLVVKGNRLSGLNGGYITARTYVGTPNNAHFSNNIHNSQANNIRVTGGSMSISNEKFEKGFNEYGAAKVEKL